MNLKLLGKGYRGLTWHKRRTSQAVLTSAQGQLPITSLPTLVVFVSVGLVCLTATLFAVELLCLFVLVLFVLVLFVHSHFIMCLDMIIIIIKMAKRDKTGVQASRS